MSSTQYSWQSSYIFLNDKDYFILADCVWQKCMNLKLSDNIYSAGFKTFHIVIKRKKTL